MSSKKLTRVVAEAVADYLKEECGYGWVITIDDNILTGTYWDEEFFKLERDVSKWYLGCHDMPLDIVNKIQEIAIETESAEREKVSKICKKIVEDEEIKSQSVSLYKKELICSDGRKDEGAYISLRKTNQDEIELSAGDGYDVGFVYLTVEKAIELSNMLLDCIKTCELSNEVDKEEGLDL